MKIIIYKKYDNVVDNYIQLNLKIKSSSLYVSNIVCNNFTEKKNTQTVFINLKQILNPYIQEKNIHENNRVTGEII